MTEHPVAGNLATKTTMTDKQKDFLVKDYELKVRYLSDHFQRMWTRFNFFLTVESGLLGGKIIIGKGMLNKDISLVLLFISVIWYLFGAQDRYLVGLYRDQIRDAGAKAADTILEDSSYVYAGKPGKASVFKSMTEWYIKPVSITTLAALIPLTLILIWGLAVIVFF